MSPTDPILRPWLSAALEAGGADASPMPASGWSAARAVSDAAARDAVAAEVMALFDQYRRPLLGYVRSLGLGAHDAEDVVQDVFVALFRHLQLARPRHNLVGWLFQVAHNLGRRHQSRWRPWWRRQSGEADLAIADSAAGPEERLVEREQERRWQGVLRALPPRDRRCLLLRAEGYTYRQIAAMLDVSLGTVAKAVVRTLDRFERARMR